MKLSNYSNIFGKPNESFHKYRLGGIAIVDLLTTMFIAMILSYICEYQFLSVFVFLLILGVFVHWLFNVDTAFNKFIKDFYEDLCLYFT